MNFKKTLITTLLLFAVVPVLIISAEFLQITKDNNEKATLSKLSLLSSVSGNVVEKLLSVQIREASLLAKSDVLISALSAGDEDKLKEIQLRLKSRSEAYPEYEDAAVFNENGVKVIDLYNKIDKKDTSYAETVFFKKTVENPNEAYVSDIITSILDPNKKVFSINVAIKDPNANDKVLGVISFFIDSTFFKKYTHSIAFDKTGISYILDSKNNIIYHSQENLIGKNFTEFGIDTSDFDTFRREHSPKDVSYVYNREKFDASLYFIRQSGWVFVVRQSVKEIKQASEQMTFVLTVGILITTLLAFVSSILLAGYFLRPLKNLKNAISKVTESHQYKPFVTKSFDEFNDLSDGYNTMIYKLDENFNSLNMSLLQIAQQEEENKVLAYSDPITCLYNRTYLLKKLDNILQSNVEGGVIFIDVDDFKNVNDLLGHKVGDKLLSNLANKLKALDDNSHYTRFGGDEFVIIKLGSAEDIARFCIDISDAMQEPITVADITIPCTASFGVALFPANGNTCDDLLKKADIAMYQAKQMGKNTFSFFTYELNENFSRVNHIKDILNECIVNNEIFAHFQPELDLQTDKVVGFEALMRIKNSELGFISPVEFIPIAEVNGFIGELGFWMFKESCLFMKSLLDSGYDVKFMSVNISAVQIADQDFLLKVKRILTEVNIDPSFVQVEVTESLLMSNLDIAVSKLVALREMGMTVALDDFGTSYSSLNYLISLPIDILKIDKSFIDDICSMDKKQFVAESIISMAHKIGLKVVGEGIETLEQKNFMKEKGCDILQGYFFSRPLLKEDILPLIENIKREVIA